MEQVQDAKAAAKQASANEQRSKARVEQLEGALAAAAAEAERCVGSRSEQDPGGRTNALLSRDAVDAMCECVVMFLRPHRLADPGWSESCRRCGKQATRPQQSSGSS